MAGKSEAESKLSFSYSVAALAGVGVTAAIVGALAWVNAKRAEAELEDVKAKLCTSAELASEAALNDEPSPASWQAWAIVDALVGARSEERWDIRVLQQSNGGWKQWHRWSQEPEWVHDAEIDAVARSNKCAGSIRNGTVRVMRPLRTGRGIPSVIVVERTRQ